MFVQFQHTFLHWLKKPTQLSQRPDLAGHWLLGNEGKAVPPCPGAGAALGGGSGPGRPDFLLPSPGRWARWNPPPATVHRLHKTSSSCLGRSTTQRLGWYLIPWYLFLTFTTSFPDHFQQNSLCLGFYFWPAEIWRAIFFNDIFSLSPSRTIENFHANAMKKVLYELVFHSLLMFLLLPTHIIYINIKATTTCACNFERQISP